MGGTPSTVPRLRALPGIRMMDFYGALERDIKPSFQTLSVRHSTKIATVRVVSRQYLNPMAQLFVWVSERACRGFAWDGGGDDACSSDLGGGPQGSCGGHRKERTFGTIWSRQISLCTASPYVTDNTPYLSLKQSCNQENYFWAYRELCVLYIITCREG